MSLGAYLAVADNGRFGKYPTRQKLDILGRADFEPLKRLIVERDYAGAAAKVSDSMLRLAIIGSPAEVIERIEWLAEAGITQVNLGGPLGPDPAEAIRLMGSDVIPRFR